MIGDVFKLNFEYAIRINVLLFEHTDVIMGYITDIHSKTSLEENEVFDLEIQIVSHQKKVTKSV